jgi:hypothetical protein
LPSRWSCGAAAGQGGSAYRSAQLGADGSWGAGGGAAVIAGADVLLAERTGWRRQLSALAGVRWSGVLHSLQLNVRVYDGPSAMGEFFLTPERYISLEVGAKF